MNQISVQKECNLAEIQGENTDMTTDDIKNLLDTLHEKYLAPIEQSISEQNIILNDIQLSLSTLRERVLLNSGTEILLNENAADTEQVNFDLNKLYQSHIDFDINNLSNDMEFELLQRKDVVGWWRYERFFEPVFKCLSHTKNNKWLTVGDPFGSDAFQMNREGFKDVLPTNIGEHLLKESKQRGLIQNYQVENAESLSFDDNSFDYILCKEAYHHFPRPMIALYEMLRVAKKAVVLIEPQDPYIDHPAHIERMPIGYEKSGNYVYTLSRRELEKVALGLNLPAIATKGHVDIWYEGASYILANEDNPEFIKYRNQVEEAERRCASMQQKYGYLFAIIYKERPEIDRETFSVKFSKGWVINSFPGNPYI